jgi:diguanylate cyclase (GGDEF)-like protein
VWVTDAAVGNVGADLGVRVRCAVWHRGVRSHRQYPDITSVKSVTGGRKLTLGVVGASLLVFTAGPAAIVAIPLLQRAHLIANTPLLLLVTLLVACSVSNAVAQMYARRLTPVRGLHLRAATAAVSTAWVVYATGWGSILLIGFGVGIADLMRVYGSRAWKPGLYWSGFAVILGEITIALGWAPTILRPAVAHTVALTTFLCLALIARTLGSSALTAERAHEQIERDRSYFRDLVQHAADVIALVSPDFKIDYISPGIEPLVGLAPPTCVGLHIRDVLGVNAAEDIARAYDTVTLSDYVACEWHLTNEFQEQRRAYARLTRRHDGSLVLNLRDVTEQRALEAQLEYRASVDALTGLPNRAALMQQLAQHGTLDETAVLFIDLDGFKEVNDALGHESGDNVLRDVARRIAEEVPAGVTVGRLGGDEFLAIMSTVDEATAVDVARGIIAGIEQLGTKLTRFPLSASVGIASGYRAESAEQLLHRADQAMYRAKAGGPGRCDYAGLAATNQ